MQTAYRFRQTSTKNSRDRCAHCVRACVYVCVYFLNEMRSDQPPHMRVYSTRERASENKARTRVLEGSPCFHISFYNRNGRNDASNRCRDYRRDRSRRVKLLRDRRQPLASPFRCSARIPERTRDPFFFRRLTSGFVGKFKESLETLGKCEKGMKLNRVVCNIEV